MVFAGYLMQEIVVYKWLFHVVFSEYLCNININFVHLSTWLSAIWDRLAELRSSGEDQCVPYSSVYADHSMVFALNSFTQPPPDGSD